MTVGIAAALSGVVLVASAALIRVMMSRIGDGSRWERRELISGTSAPCANAHRVAAMTLRYPNWSSPSDVVRLIAWWSPPVSLKPRS